MLNENRGKNGVKFKKIAKIAPFSPLFDLFLI